MSTIAFKDNIMAVDGLNITSGFIEQKSQEKIWRIEVKRDDSEEKCMLYLAVIGNYMDITSFVAWFIQSRNPQDFMHYFENEKINFSALLYNSDTKELFKYDCSPTGVPVGAPFSIGSGSKYAMGAMLYGAGPVEALNVASKLDVHTSNNIHFIDVTEKGTQLSYVH